MRFRFFQLALQQTGARIAPAHGDAECLNAVSAQTGENYERAHTNKFTVYDLGQLTNL